MNVSRNQRTTYGSTALFVLLWSSGAIFSKWGLEHASALTFLILRFAIALTTLSVCGVYRRRWLPRRGTRLRVALTGSLLSGGYSICYFLALEWGVTPGILATLLGVQPILTLLLFERQFSVRRLIGLSLAMCGVGLIVYQSVDVARSSGTGTGFALGALGCMTIGAILQKGINQSPLEVLPLQYAVSLLLCILVTPFESLRFEFDAESLIPLLWLGLVISVVAQLLLYRLIRAGNLVNVTSLFYLVPVVTAALDLLLLGNRLVPSSLIGMGTILLGLLLVFKKAAISRH
jgi:drug/metabolite transporter (DMT)-like permease